MKRAGKTLIGIAALLLADLMSFSFFAVLGFFFILLYVYLSESAGRRDFRFSFWLTQAVFLVVMANIPVLNDAFLSILLPVSALIVYGVLTFFILGLMNVSFSNKLFIYGLTSTVLLFSFFAALFYLMPPFSDASFWNEFFWMVLNLGIVYFMFKEFWRTVGLRGWRRSRLYGFVLGALSVEIASLAAFLPLGFLNAAAFMALIFLILRDVVFARENGLLNISFVFREVTIFVVITSLIFVTVSWKI